MVGTATAAVTFATFSGVLAGPTMFVQLYGWTGSYASVFGLLSVMALLGSHGRGADRAAAPATLTAVTQPC
ncbi:MAG: hypothetical protein ACOC71_01060 [Hyphomicrobiales bacterium]